MRLDRQTDGTDTRNLVKTGRFVSLYTCINITATVNDAATVLTVTVTVFVTATPPGQLCDWFHQNRNHCFINDYVNQSSGLSLHNIKNGLLLGRINQNLYCKHY